MIVEDPVEDPLQKGLIISNRYVYMYMYLCIWSPSKCSLDKLEAYIAI